MIIEIEVATEETGGEMAPDKVAEIIGITETVGMVIIAEVEEAGEATTNPEIVNQDSKRIKGGERKIKRVVSQIEKTKTYCSDCTEIFEIGNWKLSPFFLSFFFG